VHGCGLAVDHDVGLERGEAALHDLAPERRDVVVRAKGRRAEQRAEARTGGAAMRPIEAHAIAQGSAEELVHGDAERLRLEVPERQLDARDGLVRNAAEVLAGAAVASPRQPLVTT